MDPLSLTAGVINIVDSSRRTLQALSSSSSWQGERASLVQLETQICIQILDEMGQIALSYTSSIPESASLCLRLCQRHLQVLDKHLTDLKKAPRKLLPVTELEKTLKDFRRSVNSLTQHLVKEYRHAIRGINVGDMYINNSIDTTLDVEATKEHVRPVMDQLGKMLAEGVNCSTLYINNSFMDRIDLESNKPEEVLNQLRQAVRNVSNNADTMQSEPDPFEFQAKILSSDGDSSEPISICAKSSPALG
ncbi:type specific antigen domain-containing protein [Pochonia chlamydosporia 170]|uniref:Type specific antigen domain-containing protein n=1 Tax=Pochonia chlamydosporia 170 TaxID=1380566 RepID=A0A179F4D8_METCM|nr:type specific antigen domain-containing protein [Pochonia chlamydosporia 170]OAQ60276.1 type specific antigen domain-containing protein [Pochonia chlamydosporia 170]